MPRRNNERLLKAHKAVLTLLGAVSSGLEAKGDVPAFIGRMSHTVADLVGAHRAAFWRLGPRGLLTVQPEPYGHGFLNGATLGDEGSIAVGWRSGDRVIGTLAAYDSERGFTPDDEWVLRVAATATGLVWRQIEAAEQLGTTQERLQEAPLARHLAASVHDDDSLQLLTAAELQLERIRAHANDDSAQAARLDELKSTIRSVEDSLRGLPPSQHHLAAWRGGLGAGSRP